MCHPAVSMAPANDETFRTLFEPHRRPITLHCYRMLGSLQDAEEVVQDTLLRAWQRQEELRATSALRAWLYRIATNACLDHLAKVRRRRALPHLVGPAVAPRLPMGPVSEERLWVEPAPDTLLDAADEAPARPDQRVSARESIGLAFITALQRLSPKQRAALILIDVLGWTPQETAALLETSVASVNSLLQRARGGIEARGEAAAPAALSKDDAALLQRFITTWESGDLEAFAALLARDAILAMPPQPEWFSGRDALRTFFGAVWAAVPGRRRLLPLRANGGPAVALYTQPPHPNAVYEAIAIVLIEIRAGQVAALIRFASPVLFPHFGVPTQLVAHGEDAAARQTLPRARPE